MIITKKPHKKQSEFEGECEDVFYHTQTHTHTGPLGWENKKASLNKQ